jgi:glycosyltransferase involved in cell wall biosynthesis
MPISILILTLNEEVNIGDCIQSVSWSDDIVVFDSFSTDTTAALAGEYGARLFQRRFDDYASQRNAALHEVAYRNKWLFILDADERMTPELRDEVKEVVSRADESMAMFRVRRKDMLMGRWLRRSSGYPTWFERLVRPDRVRVERAINEKYYTDGLVGSLCNHLIHFPFSKGIAWWIERHNRYSTMEAKALMEEMGRPVRLREIISPDPVCRRNALKQVAFRLPARPFLVFFYLYFFRLGVLDGRPGWMFCRLRSFYEYMIDLKVSEMRRNGPSAKRQ